MKSGVVYFGPVRAGVLAKFKDGTFVFRYLREYLADEGSRAVSATLPKTAKAYRSPHLFAFFHGLMAEGSQKKRQCKMLKIDEHDSFSLLLATSSHGAQGAVCVKGRVRTK